MRMIAHKTNSHIQNSGLYCMQGQSLFVYYSMDRRIDRKDLPLLQGVEQIVTKSMTVCSSSNTVVLVPCMIVTVEVWNDFSHGIPPQKIMYGSLQQQRWGNNINLKHIYTHTNRNNAISQVDLKQSAAPKGKQWQKMWNCLAVFLGSYLLL